MDKNSLTRETLLIKIRDRHDHQAWEEFSQIYSGFIWSILIKMNVPPHEQDDLAQEILIKAWKSLPDFNYQRSRGKFRNSLGLVVSNTVKTWYRKNKTAALANLKFDRPEDVEPEIDAIARQEWEKFISGLAWENVSKSLSEPVRRCFELISEGADLKEVGEQLDLNYNTVCVYKKRIIAKIAREISRLENEFG